MCLGSEVLLPNLTLLPVAPTGDSLHLKIPSVVQCMAWWLKDVFSSLAQRHKEKTEKTCPLCIKEEDSKLQ